MKIAITGIGIISAAGRGVKETLATFKSGSGNPGQVSGFSTDLSYPVFEVKNQYVPEHKDGMRTIRLALIAAEEAVTEAGLPDKLSSYRVGVCLGTTVASQLNDIDFYREYRISGTGPAEPVDRYLNGNLAESIARKLQADGPQMTVVNACSSGSDAIGVAAAWLKSGLCDIVIAGGADELNRVPFCGFGSLGILSASVCRPFDRERRGLNLGEGAGILVLESEDTARNRGIEPLLFLSGYGSAGDAYHLTAPHPEGAGLNVAIKSAMAEAGINPKDISFVNAHGTGTRENDKVEGSTLLKIFGPEIKFYSTKGFIGHTLGAAGGLEAAFTAMGLKESWIPASPGFKSVDDQIAISPVTKITPVKGSFALSTSLAFGGINSALIISLE